MSFLVLQEASWGELQTMLRQTRCGLFTLANHRNLTRLHSFIDDKYVRHIDTKQTHKKLGLSLRYENNMKAMAERNFYSQNICTKSSIRHKREMRSKENLFVQKKKR